MTDTFGTGGLRPRVHVDLARYWSSMVVVAAIAAFAGLVVVRLAGDLFDTVLIVPERSGVDQLVPLSDGRVIWTAVLVTAAAAGVLNLMLYLVPRPEWFYTILALVTMALSVVWPFSLDVDGDVQAWLVVLDLTVGLIVLVLTLVVARAVTRPAEAPRDTASGPVI